MKLVTESVLTLLNRRVRHKRNMSRIECQAGKNELSHLASVTMANGSFEGKAMKQRMEVCEILQSDGHWPHPAKKPTRPLAQIRPLGQNSTCLAAEG